MKKQVNKLHYKFERYLDKPRWMSFYHQISLISNLNPKSILEIGVGTNFLKKYFSDTKIEYKTLDIAKDLKPDILGSVDNIPLKDNSFDLVCVFQVLEHLPFDKFEKCLKEISRVSKKYVLISLPHSNLFYYAKIKIPLIKPFYVGALVPQFWRIHKFDGEHHWEIGTKRHSFKKIKEIIKKIFVIRRIIHPDENKYHIFFVLENKK